MKRRTGIYSLILTSIVCMLAGGAFAAPAVRMLGTGSKVVSAGTGSVGAVASKNTNSGTAVTGNSQVKRASSLRFSPNTVSNKESKQSGSVGLTSNSSSNSVALNNVASPSARLSIGKYLNLSHSSTGVTPGGTGGTGSGVAVDELRSELDNLRTQVERLESGKQDALVVDEDTYIEIAGKDGKDVISIDIAALEEDLKKALSSEKDLQIEMDNSHKLWWCYTDSEHCGDDKKLVVSLGDILANYDFVNNNVPLIEALNGKQGVLTTDNFLDIDGNKISVDVEELKTALRIPDEQKDVEFGFSDDGNFQWRYVGDESWTQTTKKVSDFIDLSKYVTSADFETALGGKQGVLTTDGYLNIDGDNKIGVNVQDLRVALSIPEERAVVMQFTEDGYIQWQYVGDTNWTQTTSKIGDFLSDYAKKDDLSKYLLKTEVGGLQGALIASDDGFLEINGNEIGIKVAELREELEIPEEKADIELEITDDGELRWRYLNDFEADGTTEKWTVVSRNINALIDAKLSDYAKTSDLSGYAKTEDLESLSSVLDDKQGVLTEAENGFIEINQDAGTIGVRVDGLKTRLGIDDRISEIVYEDGVLKWRYVDEYEADGETKKWTVADINELLAQSLDDYVQVATLEDYVQKSDLVGLQGALTASEDGFLQITDNKIGVKFTELQEALEIPEERAVVMQFTEDGYIQWQYDGDESWTQTTKKISDFVDLSGIESGLQGKQGVLTTDGFLSIDDTNKISVNVTDLRSALDIPAEKADIELEITEQGVLRWRYVDEYEADGETKKWTVVEKDIASLIDGKLAAYVSNASLTDTLKDYINSEKLSNELKDYATKTYVDDGLKTKQVKLTEAENGFIAISPIDDGDGETIGLKYDDLKSALQIDGFRTSEMRVQDGVLQWRYTDEFETDTETGDSVAKWTTVYNLTALLDGLVTSTDFNAVVERIDEDLAGKQVKLTATDDGFIQLSETGEIGIDMEALRSELSIDAGRTSELRVEDGSLQWRYTDEETWHVLDLSDIYVSQTNLTDYYTKTEVDGLAQEIEDDINSNLKQLLPDEGLYLLDVTGTGDDKTHVWRQVQIVDGDGIVH